MCGIIGAVGRPDAAEVILDGLRRLEYRGYDSAGIATLVDGKIERRRAEGKLANLQKVLMANPLPGSTGIGHTRWATHGGPTENNAHPHATDDVAVVHNGIIENFLALRRELEGKGHKFVTETDTEVIAHLLTDILHAHPKWEPRQVVAQALKHLEGAFALAIIFKGHEGLMLGARRGSPLVLGHGNGAIYLGSDAIALATLTNRITYLEEGDWVEVTPEAALVHNEENRLVVRPVTLSAATGALIDKGNYRHFMLKEIYEQPTVVAQTMGTFLNPLQGTVELPRLPFELADVERITIVACGTSFYAGLTAKYWLEKLGKTPVDVDIASEFRYRELAMRPGGLALFISQSGETADTLAALRYARSQGQHIVSVVNVPESSMARESDLVLSTHAGPEIGVASTKAFTCQLAVLACFAVAFGRARGALSADDERAYCDHLNSIPKAMAEVLKHDERIRDIAHDIKDARSVLYLGRGPGYPIALEGALKLKEISYIHAEGYAAGEMKHGPIALIDANVPVVVIAPSGGLYDKTVSNMQEVIARDGKVVLLSDKRGVELQSGAAMLASLELPEVDDFSMPLLYAVPIQLLSYHVAVIKGTDVDQPRNLAKSVTVE
jgi:glucosamine--fructose-6-phosphate aminotransferase (isomerizing)